MAMRAGWTVNGKHFAETITRRLYSRRTMYFIDGVPTKPAEWHAAYKAAKAAEAEAKAVAEVLAETTNDR